MVEKKRTDEGKPPETGNPSPRTREASKPFRLLGNAYVSEPDVSHQLTEETNESLEESDPPIVVRDGRADHTAKGRAGGQREHSTHRGRGLRPIPVSRTLLATWAELGFIEPDAEPRARLSEEPCAGKPHAGICEGGTR